MVTQVRSTLDEGGITSGKWSDSEIIRNINNAKNHFVNVINTINQNVNGKSASITFTTGTELYDLPNDLDSILRVELASNKEKVNEISVDQKELYRASSDLFDPDPCYYLLGNQIGLINGGSVTVYYLKRVPDLHYGTAVTGGTTTTLIFDATPNGSSTGDFTVKKEDDYYIGAYIDMYSGTGSPQVVKITDYTGSTRTATFATASAHDTTTLYALKYDLPNEVDYCIVLLATIFLCPKDRTKSISSLNEVLRGQTKAMTDGLARTKEHKYVRYIEN